MRIIICFDFISFSLVGVTFIIASHRNSSNLNQSDATSFCFQLISWTTTLVRFVRRSKTTYEFSSEQLLQDTHRQKLITSEAPATEER